MAMQGQLYLGKVARGQYFNLTLTTTELPDATPTVTFWREGSTSVETLTMPYIKGKTFALRKMAGSSYTDGAYAAVMVYTIDAVNYTAISYFQVQGGDGSPPIVSVTEIDRSLGRAVVTQDEDGTMMIGYRPRRT